MKKKSSQDMIRLVGCILSYLVSFGPQMFWIYKISEFEVGMLLCLPKAATCICGTCLVTGGIHVWHFEAERKAPELQGRESWV